ncbi:SGNH/GDSL hydrolase family protein [Dermacoccaceae bacterium W4C1]
MTSVKSLTALAILAVITAGLVWAAVTGRTLTSPASDSTTATQPTTGASTTSADSSATSTEAGTAVAVYGDGVSAGSGTLNNPNRLSDRSWVKYVDDQGWRFLGGYAAPGTTTRTLVQDARPVQGATVSIAFVGMRDAYSGGTVEDSITQLAALQKKVGGGQRAFVVVALGPASGLRPAALETWNEDLQKAAQSRGWIYVDPWQGLRDDDFGWTQQNLSHDATTPSAAGAELLAKNLVAAVEKAW